MSYFINKKMEGGISFESTVEKVTGELKKEGFGVLTEIDIKSTFKNKLDVDMNKYVILGACNPNYAFNALKEDSKLGVFLPCNVIVEEHDNGEIEVSAVDPIASMLSVKNEKVEVFAKDVLEKLERVIANL
jgi:uncharacterized protein (DUF302 family)